MYFRHYGLRKTWLDECLKNHASDDPLTSKMVKGQNTMEIWTTAPLASQLITVKAIELEKVSHSDMQDFSAVS